VQNGFAAAALRSTIAFGAGSIGLRAPRARRDVALRFRNEGWRAFRGEAYFGAHEFKMATTGRRLGPANARADRTRSRVEDSGFGCDRPPIGDGGFLSMVTRRAAGRHSLRRRAALQLPSGQSRRYLNAVGAERISRGAVRRGATRRAWTPKALPPDDAACDHQSHGSPSAMQTRRRCRLVRSPRPVLGREARERTDAFAGT
jgi:hypothetical protein